ncbi:MAG: hypothetical protein Q4D79_08350 [Propionibacteriaceae bacterium]|nr:hypothetical protein [Propionibacteriaceae bacterium]
MNDNIRELLQRTAPEAAPNPSGWADRARRTAARRRVQVGGALAVAALAVVVPVSVLLSQVGQRDAREAEMATTPVALPLEGAAAPSAPCPGEGLRVCRDDQAEPLPDELAERVRAGLALAALEEAVPAVALEESPVLVLDDDVTLSPAADGFLVESPRHGTGLWHPDADLEAQLRAALN